MKGRENRETLQYSQRKVYIIQMSQCLSMPKHW